MSCKCKNIIENFQGGTIPLDTTFLGNVDICNTGTTLSVSEIIGCSPITIGSDSGCTSGNTTLIVSGSSVFSCDIDVLGGIYSGGTNLIDIFSSGGGDLATVLAAGNTTSGNNIIMTEGDDVIFKYAGFNNNINTEPITTNRNINFPDNDGVVALTSDIKPFTGNTSGSCITDLYVSNLYGCSPITLNEDIQIINGFEVRNTGDTIGLMFDFDGFGLYDFTQLGDTNNGFFFRPDFDGLGNGYSAILVGGVDRLFVDPVNSLIGISSGYDLQFGGVNNTTIVRGTPSGDISLTLPSTTGIIALTSDITPFTGNTSGSCITDLYVTNLYGCSPINIQNDTIIDGGLTGTTGLFSSNADGVLTVIGSGNTNSDPLFKVEGSSGELFSVTDSLEGSLFSVNDISGLPILDVNSDSTIQMGSITAPSLFTTVLTTATGGTENIYSLPTSAYTGGFFDYTLVGNGGARAGVITSIWSGTTTQYQDVSTNDIGSSTSGVTFDVSVSGNNAILSVSAVTGTYTIKTIVRSI